MQEASSLTTQRLLVIASGLEKVPPARQCLRRGCRAGRERSDRAWLAAQHCGSRGCCNVDAAASAAQGLRTISVGKLEPLETALVNEARLRSLGCVGDETYGVLVDA